VSIQTTIQNYEQRWPTLRLTIYILGALLLFLFTIDLLVASLQHVGRPMAEAIILATSNPYTGLFIGLLITAMIQSSSTTTALTVALVASGSVSLESAVPIIMGANIGTTITSTIISLGFINKKKEFKRAVSAGTYHDFFNILTAVILFPLEYYYRFVSSIASWLTSYFFTTQEATQVVDASTGVGFGWLATWLVNTLPDLFVVVLAFALLFGSILLFRKLISDLLLVKSPEQLGNIFFKSEWQSFVWGLGTTAAIRSSTVTTSLVVPLVAKRVVKLKQAAPFILGANIGTTITAFIAAILYTNTASAITIAMVHFLFNFIGVLIFFPVPMLRRIPMDLAEFLGKLTLRYRVAGLAYLLLTFFIIPFSLIYLNRDSVETATVVYEERDAATNGVRRYELLSRINHTTHNGQWIILGDSTSREPNRVAEFSFRDNVLLTEGTMLIFSKPGYCWDGEDAVGKYKVCIDSIVSPYTVSPTVSIDSVYIFSLTHYADSSQRARQIYMSPAKAMILREVWKSGHQEVKSRSVISVSED
jgi:solute carrier family 34 (sodium-dependent phosphate cotransporter)